MFTAPALWGLLVLLGAGVLAARLPATGWGSRLLEHRRAPWLFGLATALSCWWVARATLDVEPISTDEAAYLLQARIFAAGHVTAPAAPIPEFFEQAWVVVTPKLYAKYPPGHSLALAPGVALGLPWLVPMLLSAVAGALLFALTRRGVGPPAAVLVWVAWVLSGMAMAWQTSYFSEVTLLVCWLGAAACTWRWRDGEGNGWLLGAAALAGYGAITRPLSILLLALPLGVVVLRDAARGRRWREVGAAAAIAGAFVLALPAWNLATTGSAARSPLREYTERYLPWDRLGFAVESTAARRPTPPDLEGIAPQLVRVHREHTVARLPRTLWERVSRVWGILFTHWRAGLALFALLGLWRLPVVGWIALGTIALQFLGHLIWGHQAGWTLYYAETAALWFVPGAVGVVRLWRWLAVRGGSAESVDARIAMAALIALPFLIGLSLQDSAVYRGWRTRRATESRAFSEMVRTGPGQAIYFVRYGALTSGRPGLIRNDPWLATARDWIVYDRGTENDALRRLAPGRAAFLVDVAARRVTPFPPLAPPPTPP